jgi:putative membrane protein
MRSLLAALHFIALAIGFAAVIMRGSALQDALRGEPLKKLFVADNFWGLAAVLWLGTGALRVWGPYEKGSDYYLQNHWFYAKMALFLAVFLLEILPMKTLILWRIQKKEFASAPDFPRLNLIFRINLIEACLILLIPIFASLMARG